MKIFQTLLRHVAIIGIYQIGDQKSQYNRRNLAFLLFYGLFTAFAAAFMIFDANRLQDYEQSFFALLSASFTFVDFFVFIQKTYQISRLFERAENEIKSRKLMLTKWHSF